MCSTLDIHWLKFEVNSWVYEWSFCRVMALNKAASWRNYSEWDQPPGLMAAGAEQPWNNTCRIVCISHQLFSCNGVILFMWSSSWQFDNLDQFVCDLNISPTSLQSKHMCSITAFPPHIHNKSQVKQIHKHHKRENYWLPIINWYIRCVPHMGFFVETFHPFSFFVGRCTPSLA